MSPSPIAALALAALFAFAPAAVAAQDEDATAETRPRPVKLMTVAEPRTRITRTFFGQIVARQTVDLAFQVGGQLAQLPVENGQRVDRGALLARLDLEPFERAVERAELQLDQAESDYDRARQLAESNVRSQAQLDDARTNRDLARIELREAREALDDATLRAAFDGLVARRLVANYTTVAQGTPVLRLHDMSEPRVELAVPERLFRRIGDLDDIAFSADLGAGHDGVPLSLAEYSAETVGISQSYIVDLALPPLDGFLPLPGRTATVRVTLSRPGGDTLSVPPEALRTTPDRGTEVMVFEPAGAATGSVRPVPVSVVTREGADVAVTRGEALAPGMEIVATGAHLLTEGQRVRRFTGFNGGG